MGKREYGNKLLGWAVILFTLLTIGCASRKRVRLNPEKSDEYEKIELLMLDEEKKLYRHLRNQQDRDECIRDFWKIRDPDPTTEENEAKVEFQRRIEYANLWFSPTNPYPGRKPGGREYDNGWYTDRGRIYILLGPPDLLFLSNFYSKEYISDSSSMQYDVRAGRDRRVSDGNRYSAETWRYDLYRISVSFVKQGIWRMSGLDTDLAFVIEQMKMNLVSERYSRSLKHIFQFKAGYQNGNLLLTIPLKRIVFDGENKSEFSIRIIMYQDYRKIGEMSTNRQIHPSGENIRRSSDVTLTIPLSIEKRGSILLDITMENLIPTQFTRSRKFLKVKI